MKNLFLILFLCVFFDISAHEQKNIFKITEYKLVPSEKGEMPEVGSKYIETYFNFKGQKIQQIYFDTSEHIQSVRLYYDNQDVWRRSVDIDSRGKVIREDKEDNPKIHGFVEQKRVSCCGTTINKKYANDILIEEEFINEYTLKIEQKIVYRYEYYE